MAPESQPLFADDTDSDSGAEPVQKTARHGVRKRLSEAFMPDNEASLNSDNGARPPLRSVNINDDAAEKRRRRKSTKLINNDNSQAGPSNEGDADTSRSGTRLKPPLNRVAEPSPLKNISIDVMNSNYEEWMKMATDNKITTTNSWSFALIDYFHDMSLLRNDEDNSINFQRASCTLDGCVKIWTSRVDSVGTETAKLASNLASGHVEDYDDDDGSDNPDDDGSGPKKKKSHRPSATLAKDPTSLLSKKLDLEFSVDPLFKKTCADFDEGGAQGLLMNHLSLGVGRDGSLTVVFDAGDSLVKEEDEEVVEEPFDDIDLSHLRREFVGDLAMLEDKAICHSLDGFSFAKSTSAADDTFFADDTRVDEDDDDDEDTGVPDQMDVDGAIPAVEDFFVGDEAVNEDYMGGGGIDDFGGDDDTGNGSVGASDHAGPSDTFAFDPSRNHTRGDLTLAMTDGNDESSMLDLFDKSSNKNWAGPEHWKIRKPIRQSESDPNASKSNKPRKEKKDVFKIDFTTPPDKDLVAIANELFAAPPKGASINLAGTGAKGKKKVKEGEKKDDHTLPDDMHFSSRQLVTLFLKPKFSLQLRGRREPFDLTNDGEVDPNSWAAGDDVGGDEINGDGAIPFSTQFFNDDDDDHPGFEFDGTGGADLDIDAGEQDLLAATQGQTRRVKPEQVKYAKRAKRVDVRKLKDNIWKGLDIVVSHSKSEEEMDVDSDRTPTDPAEGKPFGSVISNLETSYPRDKMEEISTSFCFICLLHLANEQGLKIEQPDLESSGLQSEPERRIGNLWDLQVYRDPDAGPAA
ncbi:condensin complex subunit 2/barren [Mycena floridula]|nr:condensin complex subunit 2/barren [Mycena floridula]